MRQLKNSKEAYFNQKTGCPPAPVCWSKYTTLVFTISALSFWCSNLDQFKNYMVKQQEMKSW